MQYKFDQEKFNQSFKVGKNDDNEKDNLKHTHGVKFKLFPYSTRIEFDINLNDIVSNFFRNALQMKPILVEYNELCQFLIEIHEIEKEQIKSFKKIIYDVFFSESEFIADNIGLFQIQSNKNNKKADSLAFFLYSISGLTSEDKNTIKEKQEKYPLNVLESMLIGSLKDDSVEQKSDIIPYFKVKENIQEQFKIDFLYMLELGMTSFDDFNILFSIYYFYYVSQACITLNEFCSGDRKKTTPLYYALDWEKISGNRLCYDYGWKSLEPKLMNMFSHAVTLEILNQCNSDKMLDYISFWQQVLEGGQEYDKVLAEEIKKAEKSYKKNVRDIEDFEEKANNIKETETEKSIKRLFNCVDKHFKEKRKDIYQKYRANFVSFCRKRWLKNRGKLGSVLNLTERDIIFLTKISITEDKIRLIDLFKQFEQRGIYLDDVSKGLLQEYYTKLNLIEKKSDSGDAQYVRKIL